MVVWSFVVVDKGVYPTFLRPGRRGLGGLVREVGELTGLVYWNLGVHLVLSLRLKEFFYLVYWFY